MVDFDPTKINQWVKEAGDVLVPIDRSGDPLYLAINTITLPELSVRMVSRLYELVKSEVKHYYERNAHKGCTRISSPRFNPWANMGDEQAHCEVQTPFQFQFGGFYVKCRATQLGAGNLCNTIEVKNGKTGDYSCPGGYVSKQLYKGVKKTTSYRQRCTEHGWWTDSNSCKLWTTDTLHSQAEYDVH